MAVVYLMEVVLPFGQTLGCRGFLQLPFYLSVVLQTCLARVSPCSQPTRRGDWKRIPKKGNWSEVWLNTFPRITSGCLLIKRAGAVDKYLDAGCWRPAKSLLVLDSSIAATSKPLVVTSFNGSAMNLQISLDTSESNSSNRRGHPVDLFKVGSCIWYRGGGMIVTVMAGKFIDGLYWSLWFWIDNKSTIHLDQDYKKGAFRYYHS